MVILFGSVFASTTYNSKEKNDQLHFLLKNYKDDVFLKSFLSASVVNGDMAFHFFSSKNHYGEHIKRIEAFFKDLPSFLDESSFGSIHIYDEEGYFAEDDVIIYVLKKGKVSKLKDLHFSPFSKQVSHIGSTQF